jgi:hypothetical protein
VVADLCARCAAESDRLLELYGGRGRDAVTLTQQGPVSSLAARASVRRVVGVVVRGLVYVLIALAAFAVVTLITARN